MSKKKTIKIIEKKKPRIILSFAARGGGESATGGSPIDDFSTEYAKSGKSKCRECEDFIGKARIISFPKNTDNFLEGSVSLQIGIPDERNVRHILACNRLHHPCISGRREDFEEGLREHSSTNVRPSGPVVPRGLFCFEETWIWLWFVFTHRRVSAFSAFRPEIDRFETNLV